MKLIWLCRNTLLKSRLVKYISVPSFLKKNPKPNPQRNEVSLDLSIFGNGADENDFGMSGYLLTGMDLFSVFT